MNYDSSDYPKAQEYMERQLHQAEQHRLSQKGETSHRQPRRLHMPEWAQTHRRRLATITIAALLIFLAVFVIPQVALAQPIIHPTDSGVEPLHDAMLAFTSGHYYYVQEDYERAVEEFTSAIEQLPDDFFELVAEYDVAADYAFFYLYLGDAQLQLGMTDEALVSFGRYLEMAGDTADPVIVELVQEGEVVG